MNRPSDWYVVDLGGDPTPGEAWGVRTLAREYGEIAASARSASTVLTRVQSSGSSAVWVGEAAEVFREKLEDFPERIAKCAASFEIVRDAMSSWASSVESWQTQADTNLNKARLAQADIEAAQAVLEAAQTAAASVQGDLDRALRTYNQYQYVEPPASVTVPSAYQISQLRYRATGASSSTTSASGTVQEAQDRFDAAKALVLAAAEEFTAAAKTVVGMIEAAKDAGVEADSWWEKIYHSDAWQVMVTIVTVVVIVAAIAAFFVTGPLALVIAAVAIVGNVILNAQDIMAFAAGDMSAAEFFITMALAFLPGGRAMKSLNNATDQAADVVRRVPDVGPPPPRRMRVDEDPEAVAHSAWRLDDGANLAGDHAIPRAEVGTKLEFVFGKASGHVKNIDRSVSMLARLQKIGIFDDAVGRQLVKSHLEGAWKDLSNVLRTQADGRLVKESLLLGPRGLVKVESIWEPSGKLITSIIHGGN